MSDTSIAILVNIRGTKRVKWEPNPENVHYEQHKMEVEPEAPLADIADRIDTECDDFVVRSIVILN